MPTPDALLDHLRVRMPWAGPLGAPVRLSGGLLNEVYRVAAGEASLIVKLTAGHLASAPEVPLSAERALIEGRALRLFEPGARLHDLAGDAIRPPRLLDLAPFTSGSGTAYVLVLEDVGAAPDLAGALAAGADDPCGRLGAFVGRLHARTTGDALLAMRFANAPVQSTRRDVQYGPVAEALATCGERALGMRVEALGGALTRPGRCLVMGDLWPPSALVPGGKVRLIDWEFAHYGRPLQDVAHLAAHLWMHAHRAPGRDEAARFAAGWRGFLDAYAAALGSEAALLWPPGEAADAATHYAAEILVRAVGTFRKSGLYADEPVDGPAVREAVAHAVDAMKKPAAHPFTAALRQAFPQT